MVEEEVAVLVVLVRRHRRAVGAAVRQAVYDEVPGAVEEATGLAAVRRVMPSRCAACTCPWCAWHRRFSTRRTARIEELNSHSPGSGGPMAAALKRYNGGRVLVFVMGAFAGMSGD